jgi:hypothetical protein
LGIEQACFRPFRRIIAILFRGSQGKKIQGADLVPWVPGGAGINASSV